MDTSESVLVKARKKHVCTWCGEDILPGDTYHRWASFDGGDVQTSKMHPECKAAMLSADLDDGIYYPYEYARGKDCHKDYCTGTKCPEHADCAYHNRKETNDGREGSCRMVVRREIDDQPLHADLQRG